MATFTFKCPACACELEVENEDRGETTPCPNCEAEITIPLVKAPQVRVPPVRVPQEDARPVQNKRLLVSQSTVNALSARGPVPKTSMKGIVAGILVGLVVGLIIGACSPIRLTSLFAGDFRTPPSLSLLRPSKGDWRNKLLQRYALRDNRIVVLDADKNDPTASEKYAVKGFQLAMGQPDKIETVGDDKALSYVCSDGQVQVLISSTNYDAGQIAGALIKDE